MCILWPWPRTLKVLSHKTIVRLFNNISVLAAKRMRPKDDVWGTVHPLKISTTISHVSGTQPSRTQLAKVTQVCDPFKSLVAENPPWVPWNQLGQCAHTNMHCVCIFFGGGAGNSWIVVVSPKTQPNQPNQKPPNNFDNFKLLWKTANQLGMFVCVCVTHARESSRVYILIAQTLPRKRTHQTVHVWPSILHSAPPDTTFIIFMADTKAN